MLSWGLLAWLGTAASLLLIGVKLVRARIFPKFRHHLLGEVKLVSPISCGINASPTDLKHRRAKRLGLGGTEQYQRENIMGRTHCGPGCQPKPAHYAFALGKGHEVLPMVHEVFGAWSDRCMDLLDRLGEIREGRLDKEFHDASWAERSFHNYYAARISIALHVGMAHMILTGSRMAVGRATEREGGRNLSGKRQFAKHRRNNAG